MKVLARNCVLPPLAVLLRKMDRRDLEQPERLDTVVRAAHMVLDLQLGGRLRVVNGQSAPLAVSANLLDDYRGRFGSKREKGDGLAEDVLYPVPLGDNLGTWDMLRVSRRRFPSLDRIPLFGDLLGGESLLRSFERARLPSPKGEMECLGEAVYRGVQEDGMVCFMVKAKLLVSGYTREKGMLLIPNSSQIYVMGGRLPAFVLTYQGWARRDLERDSPSPERLFAKLVAVF